MSSIKTCNLQLLYKKQDLIRTDYWYNALHNNVLINYIKAKSRLSVYLSVLFLHACSSVVSPWIHSKFARNEMAIFGLTWSLFQKGSNPYSLLSMAL